MSRLDELRREQAIREAERGDEPRRGLKPRERLDEKYRRLAARAFRHGLRVSRVYDKKYAHLSLDFDGAVAERLVEMIRRYDRDKSKLKTWSYSHAGFACLDALRNNVSIGRSVRNDVVNRNPLVLSIQGISAKMARNDPRDAGDHTPSCLLRRDPVTRLEADDALAHLLRGLTRQERDVMTLRYRDDLPLWAIGERLGVSESRASQLCTAALQRLRELRRSA